MEWIQGEIEYFGFVPVTFTADLQETLDETLSEILRERPSVPSKVKDVLYESFRKNTFIFSNFVLRNILKFPSEFNLERKITDKHIETDTNETVASLVLEQKKEESLLKDKMQLTERMQIACAKREGYRNLLKDKERYKRLIADTKELKGVMKEISEIYSTFKVSSIKKSATFDSLMAYRLVKNEYYKEERDRALAIAKLEDLEGLNSKLHRMTVFP